MTVVSVGYPLAPVRPDAVGGTEQILSRLDRALLQAGHRSIVVAPRGSSTAGELVEVEPVRAPYDSSSLARAEALTRCALDQVLLVEDADLVHLHAGNFGALLPQQDVPALVTLHLPRQYYAPADLQIRRRKTWMHCVSYAQHATFRDSCSLLAPIENGVELDTRPPVRRRRKYALWLGRICPEKAPHLAIDAAERAGLRLLIAGMAYGYPQHVQYFESCLAPRFGRSCRYLGPVSGECKRELLRHACCVLVTSLVPETSCLVARESLAAGTPVVALETEALSEIIEHGATGYLVADESELPEAMIAAGALDPQACQAVAVKQLSAQRMADRYLALYEAIVRDIGYTEAVA